MARIVWQPHPGSQRAFLECPYWELLYHGTRGPGKTDALLMDYAQFVGLFGPAWRGILFRRTYKQLADVIARSKKWFPRIFPGASWNGTEYTWTFPGGEQLLMRYMQRPDDYWEYHGHEYPWIGWEELTRWPTMECYEMMKACSRSSEPGMPRHIRATANPYGIGHNAVKRYFIDAGGVCEPVVEETPEGVKLKRTHVFGHMEENLALMDADPAYVGKMSAIKDEMLKKAWRHGSWDIVAGGAFDDLWDPAVHVVKDFEVPGNWMVDRSFDWGSSSPFSVLWFAESNGEAVDTPDGRKRFPAGTVFVIGEWYGGTAEEKGLKMTAAAIAKGIVERESRMDDAVEPGPADNQIFAEVNDNCIAVDMEAEGVEWSRAYQAAGSRVQGFQKVRDMLEASLAQPMERPGLFIFASCKRLRAHLPVLERDEKNMEDVDTDQADHDFDALKYRCLSGGGGTVSTEMR